MDTIEPFDVILDENSKLFLRGSESTESYARLYLIPVNGKVTRTIRRQYGEGLILRLPEQDFIIPTLWEPSSH